MRRRLTGVVVAAVCLLGAATAEAQWRRLDSPNFVVIGEAAARDLRDIAIKFEGFRDTLKAVMSERVTSSRVPTVIVVFQSDTMMAPFRPKYQGKPVDVGALFVPGRDLNYIVIVNDGHPHRLRLIFHEYTHLVSSNSDQRLPLWFGEGLAEYYSTFEMIGNREASLGGLIDEHLERLNNTVLIPMDELLKLTHDSPLYNEGSRRSVLYAQSWALMHMILGNRATRVPPLVQYLDECAAGVAPEEAWKKAFAGVDMQKELENYIRRMQFKGERYAFTEGLTRIEQNAVTLPPAEAQAWLADLHTQMRDYEAARERFSQALAADASNVRASVGLTRLGLATRQADLDKASVLAMPSPKDWQLAYLAGVTAAEAVTQSGADATPAQLDGIRRHFAAARAGHEEFAHAVASLAHLEVRSAGGPSNETAAALQRIRKLAPHRYEYAYLHAQVLARARQFPQARDVIAPFMSPAFPPATRSSARNLMGYIVQVESATGGASSIAVPPGAAPPDARTETTTSLPGTGVVRPIFRELKAGEERVEGTLEQIDCVQGKGITFHLRTTTGTFTATVQTFNEVALITYRDDLKGNITCGKQTPMAVYLTWKKGETPDARIAVALEFLPKT